MFNPDLYETIDFTKTMFFDLDAPKDRPKQAEEDCRELVRYLTEIDDREVSVFSTGNNGFHILFPWVNPEGVNRAKMLAEECKYRMQLETMDMVCYQKGQKVLKEGCPNRKTGIPKTRVNLSEI